MRKIATSLRLTLVFGVLTALTASATHAATVSGEAFGASAAFAASATEETLSQALD